MSLLLQVSSLLHFFHFTRLCLLAEFLCVQAFTALPSQASSIETHRYPRHTCEEKSLPLPNHSHSLKLSFVFLKMNHTIINPVIRAKANVIPALCESSSERIPLRVPFPSCRSSAHHSVFSYYKASGYSTAGHAHMYHVPFSGSAFISPQGFYSVIPAP